MLSLGLQGSQGTSGQVGYLGLGEKTPYPAPHPPRQGCREEEGKPWGAGGCRLAGPCAQGREVSYFSCSDFPL